MRQQATKANTAQIEQHIERQRLGISGMEFAHRHPVIDAVGGVIVLAAGFGWMAWAWVKVGAGL